MKSGGDLGTQALVGVHDAGQSADLESVVRERSEGSVRRRAPYRAMPRET
jgi:hypothetical protein